MVNFNEILSEIENARMEMKSHETTYGFTCHQSVIEKLKTLCLHETKYNQGKFFNEIEIVVDHDLERDEYKQWLSKDDFEVEKLRIIIRTHGLEYARKLYSPCRYYELMTGEKLNLRECR